MSLDADMDPSSLHCIRFRPAIARDPPPAGTASARQDANDGGPAPGRAQRGVRSRANVMRRAPSPVAPNVLAGQPERARGSSNRGSGRPGRLVKRVMPMLDYAPDAGVAQLVEHQPSKLNVARSSRVARFCVARFYVRHQVPGTVFATRFAIIRSSDQLRRLFHLRRLDLGVDSRHADARARGVRFAQRTLPDVFHSKTTGPVLPSGARHRQSGRHSAIATARAWSGVEIVSLSCARYAAWSARPIAGPGRTPA